jgi:DNA-binding HxlR family transcriptional regulator
VSRKRFDDMRCSIAQTLNQVGDWWSLLIIRDAMTGKHRFSEFEESLGISKNILHDRLNTLVEFGILKRVEVGEYGSRHEYRLTPKGRDLFVVINALRQWGDKWIYQGEKPPMIVKDKNTRQAITPIQVTNTKGQVVSLQDVYMDVGY